MGFMSVVYVVGAVIAAVAVLAIAKKVLKLAIIGAVALGILAVGSAHGWVPKSAVPAPIAKLVPTSITDATKLLPTKLPGLDALTGPTPTTRSSAGKR